MRREDWICRKCGDELIKAYPDGQYMVCPEGCGRLILAPKLADLPIAMRVDYKRFVIPEHESYDVRKSFWEYAPHMHRDALNHCPQPDTIVATVEWRGKWHAVRTFRRSTGSVKLGSPLGDFFLATLDGCC